MGKRALVKQILESFKGFDQTIQNLKIISADNGNCTAEFKVEPRHCNLMGNLHGGCTATLVDIASSMALLTHERGMGHSVSVSMDIKYLSAGKLSDELVIYSNTRKAGKTLAFLDVEIKNKLSNQVVATGSHVKYMLDNIKQN